MKQKRLVVVSNRLPVAIVEEDGRWSVRPGSGGLVTAMSPVLRDRGGKWIGWLGMAEEDVPEGVDVAALVREAGPDTGYALEPIPLDRAEVEQFYLGLSNSALWPLFHDLLSRAEFDPDYWHTYTAVNRKFAEVVAEHSNDDDFVWINDYHLTLVGRALAQMGARRHVGFFLHIPFPPPDIYMKLPWRRQILEALLDYDLVGFQTLRDRRNFIDCVHTLDPESRVIGRGQTVTLVSRDRELRVGAFPISIDYQEFEGLAKTKEAAEEAWIIHSNLPDRKLVLGVDRLDYTKGIPHRLRAFGNALERYPELRHNITLVQLVVPSRTQVDEYAALKDEIERLVGEINGRFTEEGWVPIHYIFRHLDRLSLVALYRTCEISLVTPLKDGMNLVAKEYCASSVEDEGVLIMSEFAGAAAQLQRHALLVNPYDIEGVADAIHQAFHMPEWERKDRMRKMRQSIRRQDIFRWVDSFLKAGLGATLSEFPGSAN